MTGGSFDWRRRFVVVFDGGDDFFQAAYDPALRRLTRLSFNGPDIYVPKHPPKKPH